MKDAGGNKLGLYTVREGVSFRVKEAGVVVTPRRFDREKKTLMHDVEAGERSLTGLVAGPQGAQLIAGVSVVPVSWHEPEPSEFVTRVRFVIPGRAPEERVIRVNEPAKFAGISFCLVGGSEDRYRNSIVGLQMTREPGEPLFWGGGILFGTSLLLHLLLRSARSAEGACTCRVNDVCLTERWRSSPIAWNAGRSYFRRCRRPERCTRIRRWTSWTGGSSRQHSSRGLPQRHSPHNGNRQG